MVCVADRKAYEQGWMLFLDINHRGQILPFRIRNRVNWVTQYKTNWLDGQALEQNIFSPDDYVERVRCMKAMAGATLA